ITGDWLADIAAAIGFLTRIPVPTHPPAMPRPLRAFPLAGALVGAVGAGFLALSLAWGLPPLVAAIAALSAIILVTGGLHEDGLADVADGFGGGKTIDDKLRIMRDSTLGTYGVLALIVSLALRATLLAAAVDSAGIMTAGLLLVAGAALSRAVVVAGLFWLAPARPDGLGHGAANPSGSSVFTALALGIGIAAMLVWPTTDGGVLLRVLVGAGIGAGGVFWLAKHQIKGQTGDVNGAAIVCAEIAVFVAAVPAL
ncbi:MAG: adenosylcobinamide-GDP ribazoletransferase, partial [Hyphomicrobiales bacterium]